MDTDLTMDWSHLVLQFLPGEKVSVMLRGT